MFHAEWKSFLGLLDSVILGFFYWLIVFLTEGHYCWHFLWEAFGSTDWNNSSIMSIRKCWSCKQQINWFWRKSSVSEWDKARDTIKHMWITVLLCPTSPIQDKVFPWCFLCNNLNWLSAADQVNWNMILSLLFTGATFFLTTWLTKFCYWPEEEKNT